MKKENIYPQHFNRRAVLLAGCLIVFIAGQCFADPDAETVDSGNIPKIEAAFDDATPDELTDEMKTERERIRQELVQKGAEYLELVQSVDGSFSTSPRSGIGPTIIVLIGLLSNGYPPDHPTVAAGLELLEKSVQDDGGIYTAGGMISGYESCLAISCFNLAKNMTGDGRYDKIIADAEQYIRGQQFNEINGTSVDDVYYGGMGYGNGTRPDLSNTQFFIETLHELGYGEEDQAIQDALVFVSRCQNLESESNPTAFASKNPDGGFFYTCVGDGESPAGTTENGGLRSYGSITYAGLKSLIYAGVDAQDPRIQAAVNWIQENYSTTSNPGLGKKGLYYYYNTLSKSFDTMKKEIFIDKEGTRHVWRSEIIDILKKQQQEDGFWVNSDRMWMENDPNLVTGYSLIVLSYCRSDGKY